MSAQLKMGLKLTQKLKMSPQLQQSIKMLTLPLMELEQVIRNEMLENPVLEEIQDTIEDQTTDELQNKEDIPEHHTWMEFTDSGFSSARVIARQNQQKQTSSHAFNWENVVSTQQTLQDHLLWQIQMSGFSNKEKAYLNLLINHLDDNGYLKSSLEEIAAETRTRQEDLQDAVQILHTMDPSGVGARNLQECLLIQARQNQEDTKDLITLIANHLPDLERKNYKAIAHAMQLQEEEVMDLYKIINAMEPKPGRRFVSQPIQYVIPDVYITKDGDSYKVSLNEDSLPHLKVASIYQEMLKKLNSGKVTTVDPTQKYLRHKMNSALWLIRSLNQRQRTIFQVTSAIARHQKDFLDNGPMSIKPLILKQIAEEVGIHESTVSRCATNKYVHTPQGIYELKYFFNLSVKAEDGRSVSGELIRLKIKSYIKDEDKSHPLSDQELSNKLLKDLGVHIARRSVGTYREKLNILPASRRKQS